MITIKIAKTLLYFWKDPVNLELRRLPNRLSSSYERSFKAGLIRFWNQFDFILILISWIFKSMSAATTTVDATASVAYKTWIFNKNGSGDEPQTLEAHWQR